MNLTIHLQEERIDPKSRKISGGYSTLEDIRSLKIEYLADDSGEYKVELIAFIGDKYNKQLVTINKLEKTTAEEISKTIHMMACIPEEAIDEADDVDKNIKNRTLHICNSINKVQITSWYDYPNEGRYKAGVFSFDKLTPKAEENNPGTEYGEIWKLLPDAHHTAFMAVLNAANKWKGDLEAIKHNTKISCGRIWKVDISKKNQVQCAVEDMTIDERYIMELYGGLNGHGDCESYLDGLRTYIKCIKRMNNVSDVNLLEVSSDLPDDLFRVLVVVAFDSSKKKKKDPNEEIDYKELI